MDEQSGAQETILVVDDDTAIRSLLGSFLRDEGYTVVEGQSGTDVLPAIQKHQPHLLLMDIRLPEQSGVQVLREIKEQALDLPVLLMTAYGNSNMAIQAMQAGAYDYITKPFDLDEVLLNVKNALAHHALARRVEVLSTTDADRDARDKFIGNTPAMQQVFKTIGRVAANDVTVLISGESGTGKELAAGALHYNSPRRGGPFIKVNCASLTETLLESELFGHEKGSFTSAVAQRKGRFELANKGTIFLDEIGEMSLNTQKKLLRVLQEREFERVGGNIPIKVDTRVVAATNKHLLEEVAAGRFREDLYYRLDVISLVMPPLRERREDIPHLVEHFLHKYRFAPSTPPARVSDDAMEMLMRHDWPGNVRELENTIQRAVVLAQGKLIAPQHLSFSPSASGRLVDIVQRVTSRVSLDHIIEDVERQAIDEALHQANGNRSRAAEILGIYRRSLYTKMRKFNMIPDTEVEEAEERDEVLGPV